MIKSYFYETKPVLPFIPYYYCSVPRSLSDPIFMGVQKMLKPLSETRLSHWNEKI